MWRWVMGILGGAAESDRRLQCRASLANKLVEGCEPVSSKEAWHCGQGLLQSAPSAKSAGRNGRAILGISTAFFALPPVCPGPARSRAVARPAARFAVARRPRQANSVLAQRLAAYDTLVHIGASALGIGARPAFLNVIEV